jgi:GTP-binding protein HflX
LILDIFAQCAHTNEGNLQVELAQLRYIATCLVRGGTSRAPEGGIILRRPDETQLETDRYLLRDRISLTLYRLWQFESSMNNPTGVNPCPMCLPYRLWAYTNAGKFTLFNRMTSAKVSVADVGDIVFSVCGYLRLFIRYLPHDLVAAFKATLQETRQASLLLHVIYAVSIHI